MIKTLNILICNLKHIITDWYTHFLTIIWRYLCSKEWSKVQGCMHEAVMQHIHKTRSWLSGRESAELWVAVASGHVCCCGLCCRGGLRTRAPSTNSYCTDTSTGLDLTLLSTKLWCFSVSGQTETLLWGGKVGGGWGGVGRGGWWQQCNQCQCPGRAHWGNDHFLQSADCAVTGHSSQLMVCPAQLYLQLGHGTSVRICTIKSKLQFYNLYSLPLLLCTLRSWTNYLYDDLFT